VQTTFYGEAVRSRNVWQALPQPGFLLSSWPWRSAAYLLSSAPVGAAALVAMVVVAVSGGVLAVLAYLRG
jgi:hypothetical protein